MKTLEFKLSLTRQQQVTIDQWLQDLKWAWNRGLEYLEWRQQWLRLQKCLEVETAWDFDLKPVEILMVKSGAKEKKKDVWAMACTIAADFRADKSKHIDIEGNREIRYVCNLVRAHWYTKPPEGLRQQKNLDVRKPFARKRCDRLSHIPQMWVNEFLDQTLSSAWKAYQKGVRKRPRYKRRQDRVDTLITASGKQHCPIEGRFIHLPGLGRVIAKGLDIRLPQDCDYSTVKITRQASGYYLQILVKNAPPRQIRSTSKEVGLDLGLQFLYATSHGREVAPQQQFRKIEEKLIKLQRQICPKKGRKFPKQLNSNNYKKAHERIARLHEKAKRSRKAFQHWHSTNLVDMFGLLVLEDLAWNKMNRRAKAKISEDGKGYQKNRASQKTGLNKSFGDAAIGQFKTMLEVKSKAAGRVYDLVSAHQTSQECPKCQHVYKKSLSQRTHQCSECGYAAGRDAAAAEVILSRSVFSRSYSGGPEEVACGVRTIASSTKKQESEAVRLRTTQVDGEVNTLPNHLLTEAVNHNKSGAIGQDIATAPGRRKRSRCLQKQSERFVQLKLWDTG